MSCSKDALSKRGISGIDSGCCAESFYFSPGQNTENIEVEGVEDTSEGRMEDYKDSAECGNFKNKRAAHYNEFKLGKSLSLSWISSLPFCQFHISSTISPILTQAFFFDMINSMHEIFLEFLLYSSTHGIVNDVGLLLKSIFLSPPTVQAMRARQIQDDDDDDDDDDG